MSSPTVSHTTAGTQPESQHPVDPERIPQALRDQTQWANWRGSKVLFNSRTSGPASSTDSSTWSSFEQACKRDPARLVYVFAKDGGLVGIDIDGCRNAETGKIDARGQAVMALFPNLYWEVSVSGTGLHGIGYGSLPEDVASRHPKGIGVKQHSGYFVMTGAALPGYETLGSFGDELAPWYQENFASKPEPSRPPEPVEVGDHPDLERIKQIAFSLRNGEKLRRLHEGGDISEYNNDESRADAGLACLWAPFTTDDGMLEDLMRDSALQRKKWDRRDYMVRTIKFARTGQSWWWDWNRQRPRLIIGGIDQDTGEILDRPEPADTDCGEMVEQLKRTRKLVRELKRDRDALIELVLNPYLTDSEKKTVASAMVVALNGKPEEDGLITILPIQLSRDTRKKPEKGQNTPLTNPDGTKPLMSRSSATSNMRKVVGRLKIEAKDEVRKVTPKGREPYAETVWRMKPPTSIADFLEPAAAYTTEPRRKLRALTPECPDCGEVHARTVQTTTHYICHGCGGSWQEESNPRVEQPIIQIGPDETGRAPMEENISPITPVNTMGDSFSSIGTEASDEPQSEAAGNADCWNCRQELEPGQEKFCKACAEQSRQRADREERIRRSGTRPCIECGDPTRGPTELYCDQHQRSTGMVAS